MGWALNQLLPLMTLPVPDTSETVHISSLALLKMLKHGIFFCFMKSIFICSGRAGVPMEVMGLMLGEFCGRVHCKCSGRVCHATEWH